MKTIYIISDMVYDTPTTKAEMFRFSLLPLKSVQKELKTEIERDEIVSKSQSISQEPYFKQVAFVKSLSILTNDDFETINWSGAPRSHFQSRYEQYSIVHQQPHFFAHQSVGPAAKSPQPRHAPSNDANRSVHFARYAMIQATA